MTNKTLAEQFREWIDPHYTGVFPAMRSIRNHADEILRALALYQKRNDDVVKYSAAYQDQSKRIAELEKHLRAVAANLADCVSALDTEGALDDTDKSALIGMVAAAQAALEGSKREKTLKDYWVMACRHCRNRWRVDATCKKCGGPAVRNQRILEEKE